MAIRFLLTRSLLSRVLRLSLRRLTRTRMLLLLTQQSTSLMPLGRQHRRICMPHSRLSSRRRVAHNRIPTLASRVVHSSSLRM